MVWEGMWKEPRGRGAREGGERGSERGDKGERGERRGERGGTVREGRYEGRDKVAMVEVKGGRGGRRRHHYLIAKGAILT